VIQLAKELSRFEQPTSRRELTTLLGASVWPFAARTAEGQGAERGPRWQPQDRQGDRTIPDKLVTLAVAAIA
jgi:hypothetical protein